jgi:hypothetical protein
VIELEEQHLRQLFPAYEAYASQVPALIPRLRFAGVPGKFRWRLYRKNEEYKALLGFLVGVGLLAAKTIW